MASHHTKDALDAAADFIKVSVSLAIGAFVFGITLAQNGATLTHWNRALVVAAAILLLLSAVIGIVAHSRIPVLISNAEFNVHDKLLSSVGRTHQVTFLVGLLLLGLVITRGLYTTPAADALRIRSATDAVRLAISTLPKGYAVRSVSTVELIRGSDVGDVTLQNWHVRLFASSKRSQSTFESFIDSASGNVFKVP